MGKRASDHFVMSAVVVHDDDLPAVAAMLAQLRVDLGRRPGETLHWKNFKGHSPRLHAAQTLGATTPVIVSSVIVCKRFFSPAQALPDEDLAYLFTLRFLLERLSWLARGKGCTLDFTLAQIVRFALPKLRDYESRLRTAPGCQIDWSRLDSHGGRIDQPSRIENLQLADIAASATFKAFEPDEFGNTEDRYFMELVPRLYRRPPGKLTSYGLKMHPSGSRHSAPSPSMMCTMFLA